MKCPKCQEEGKRSTVTQGVSQTTLMHIPIQYDEDGNRMQSIVNNTTTTNYSCSNGHYWSDKK
jgi:hypothetical protein